MRKLRIVDLFAGCGGLAEGFEQSSHYQTLAAVEWEKCPRDTFAKRLKERWGVKDAEKRTMLFDMQRTEELFSGWKDDSLYGEGWGLDKAIGRAGVDVIIGGPPCQAYSVAGRIRDPNGMKNDYRNFLFESYLKVINRYRPKAFIFENVPGLLSARPNGDLIAPHVVEAFRKVGYWIPDDLSKTIVNAVDFGVPQYRKRLIILGLSIDLFGKKCEKLEEIFYKVILPQYKTKKKVTVEESIGDLPKLYPFTEVKYINGKKYSHSIGDRVFPDHEPRFHSMRDIKIFRLLALDILSGKREYFSVDALKALYTKMTGHNSSVHKYHVLESTKPSNLIPAHLFKDGLRHIHPDPQQARTVTVREAARLQSFPDDFKFLGSTGDKYKMIGNAVPPKLAKAVADALFVFFKNNLK